MAETFIVERGKLLQYNGLIDFKGLYAIIQKLFKQHSYDWKDHKNFEQVYKDHKQIEMDLRPYKKYSDYVMVELRMDIVGTNLKEVEINMSGLKKKMYKGDLKIVFKGFLITDYENQWETKPFYYFMRMMVDKFIYKGYIDRAKDQFVDEITEAYDEIRSFLNMHRHFTPK